MENQIKGSSNVVAGESNFVHGSNNVVLPLPDNFDFNFDLSQKKPQPEKAQKENKAQQSNNSSKNNNTTDSTVVPPKTTNQSQTPKTVPHQSLRIQSETIKGRVDPNTVVTNNSHAKSTVSNNW